MTYGYVGRRLHNAIQPKPRQIIYCLFNYVQKNTYNIKITFDDVKSSVSSIVII